MNKNIVVICKPGATALIARDYPGPGCYETDRDLVFVSGDCSTVWTVPLERVGSTVQPTGTGNVDIHRLLDQLADLTRR